MEHLITKGETRVETKPRLLIGPSTGWLYANGISETFQQEDILQVAKSNVVEICLGNWTMYRDRLPYLADGKAFRGCQYRSLHLPDIDGADNDSRIVEAKSLTDDHGIVTVLTHPLKINGQYPVRSYEEMMSAGIPLAIENMDKQKDSGYNIDELENIVHSHRGYKFVLDVQHAYEHDSLMGYAKELYWAIQPWITHLHISGETEDNCHSLLYRANNAKTIIEFVGAVLSLDRLPIILEGQYSTADELATEIVFITQELGL